MRLQSDFPANKDPGTQYRQQANKLYKLWWKTFDKTFKNCAGHGQQSQYRQDNIFHHVLTYWFESTSTVNTPINHGLTIEDNDLTTAVFLVVLGNKRQ